MGFLELLLLSIGLSLDAVAICVALGLAAPRIRWGFVVEAAVWFGGAHVVMPVAGFFVGRGLGPWIAAVDHWVAASVLAAIGLRMLYAAIRGGDERPAPADPTARTLLALSLAASVDAAAVGVTLPLLDTPLAPAVATMGATAAAAAAAGVTLGRRLGGGMSRGFEIAGALVLCALAVKVLVEHLSQGV